MLLQRNKGHKHRRRLRGVKFGYSVNPRARASQVKAQYQLDRVRLLAVVPGGHFLEGAIHEHLYKTVGRRIKGYWRDTGPECFPFRKESVEVVRWMQTAEWRPLQDIYDTYHARTLAHLRSLFLIPAKAEQELAQDQAVPRAKPENPEP